MQSGMWITVLKQNLARVWMRTINVAMHGWNILVMLYDVFTWAERVNKAPFGRAYLQLI